MSDPKGRSIEVYSGSDGPIDGDQMIQRLLEACPSFEPIWQVFWEEWKDENVDLPYTLVCSDFARHMIGVLQEQDTATIQRIFDVVEQLITRGDSYVAEVVTESGLLDDLQNGGFYESALITVDREDFRQFMHPATERFWDKWYMAREGEIPKRRG